VRRLLAVGVRVGEFADAVAGAVRTTPWHVAAALATRRARRLGVAAGAVGLLLYLVAIGDIGISIHGAYGRFTEIPSAQVADDWPATLFASRAPFLFEPVLALYLLPHVALFLSAGNLLLGAVLAALLGLNVAVAGYATRQQLACRRTSYSRVLGVLPAFLTGFTCCVPSFLLLVGASVAAVLVPVFLPLRPYLFPLSLLLMAATLAWSSRRPAAQMSD
jgi:hypothetical protein